MATSEETLGPIGPALLSLAGSVAGEAVSVTAEPGLSIVGPQSLVRPAEGNRVKRFLDVALALVVVLVGMPILILVALSVVISSRGPIIFSHERVGLGGRRFRCYKFRTMVTGADFDPGEMRVGSELREEFVRHYKLRDDPRVTPLGRWLRRTSLDELPQLINVLKGEMSLVGPRPLVEPELEPYGDDVHTLLSVRPGMTGLWQVSGRNNVSHARRIALELEYATSHTISGDFKIMLRTVPQMIITSRNGAC
jgi:lipopolysaccharide/colanic/teichoic acid biosynthesis glycosyltransferase